MPAFAAFLGFDASAKSELAPKKTNVIRWQHPIVSVHSVRGLRDHMEVCVLVCTPDSPDNDIVLQDTYAICLQQRLAAVFDGHGGQNVSSYLRDNFVDKV